MTPFSSVAMLEKFALLKIAFCKAPVLSRAASRRTWVMASALPAPPSRKAERWICSDMAASVQIRDREFNPSAIPVRRAPLARAPAGCPDSMSGRLDRARPHWYGQRGRLGARRHPACDLAPRQPDLSGSRLNRMALLLGESVRPPSHLPSGMRMGPRSNGWAGPWRLE